MIKMKIQRLSLVRQDSLAMENLANKMGVTVNACGFIVGATVQMLYHDLLIPFEFINQVSIQEAYHRTVKFIQTTRKMEIRKYLTVMNQSQKKNYLKDWVANYELNTYIQSFAIERPVFFFRHCAYDHPQALQLLKFEEEARVPEQKPFKGQKFFYSKIFQGASQLKEKGQFINDLITIFKENPQQRVIIATDVLGHFNTTVLNKATVFILDSLTYVPSQFDQMIPQFIAQSYRIALKSLQ